MNRREEKTFWEARPELRHVRDSARAWRAAPWGTLGVALARVVAATPHDLKLPKEGSLNLFVALVGRSGQGKGTSTTASRMALTMDEPLALPVGSGEGIAHQFACYEKPDKAAGTPGGVRRTNWNLLVDVPEIDTLASIGGRSGSTLLPELRKAWSGEALGMGYANKEKSLPIEAHTYRLSMVAGVQPGRAGVLLNDSDGGTPQRFVWLPTSDPDAPEVEPASPPALRWVVPRRRRVPSSSVVAVCAKAAREVDAFRLANLRGEGVAMGAHEMYARLKMAAALALLSGRTDINEEDWDLSRLLADKSRETREVVQEHVQEARLGEARERGRLLHESREAYDDEERNIRRVCDNVMKRLGREKDGCAHNDLRRAMKADIRGYFDKAIVRLLDSKLIEKEPTEWGVHYTKKRS